MTSPRAEAVAAVFGLLVGLGAPAVVVADVAGLLEAGEAAELEVAEERRRALVVVAWFEPAMGPGESFAEAAEALRSRGAAWSSVADRLAAAAAVLGLS